MSGTKARRQSAIERAPLWGRQLRSTGLCSAPTKPSDLPALRRSGDRRSAKVARAHQTRPATDGVRPLPDVSQAGRKAISRRAPTLEVEREERHRKCPDRPRAPVADDSSDLTLMHLATHPRSLHDGEQRSCSISATKSTCDGRMPNLAPTRATSAGTLCQTRLGDGARRAALSAPRSRSERWGKNGVVAAVLQVLNWLSFGVEATTTFCGARTGRSPRQGAAVAGGAGTAVGAQATRGVVTNTTPAVVCIAQLVRG